MWADKVNVKWSLTPGPYSQGVGLPWKDQVVTHTVLKTGERSW